LIVEPCKKVIGCDFELANALERNGRADAHVSEAAKLLLDEISGYPRERGWGGTFLEWGRRFLEGNGGSAYIDSDHLEINLPEHGRAADHAVVLHAGLRIARKAQVAAQAKLTRGRLNVLAAVSDGHQSWGHHLNITVRRQLFDDMFTRKPHLIGFFGTHLATASIFAGHGHVGPGNKRPACDYQLSQRADWFEELVGHQTTHQRPLLNLRDEAHAGRGLARMHIIAFDNVLCPIANLLKAGTTQLVLALAEAGWADPATQLDDPLAVFAEVSRDLTLQKPLPLVGRGRQHTAVEVQRRLADLAGEFVGSGECGDAVPDAARIVALWHETLDRLARRDLDALAGRCDWVLKYLLLDRFRGRRGLSWASPDMKCLDLLFSSLDPQEGLFWQMAAAGQVEEMPAPETVERFVAEPPDDTRAYLRAHALRRFGEHVATLNWDRIRFRLPTDRYWWSETVLAMPDPSGLGREESEPLLAKSATLAELIEAVATEPEPEPYHGSSWRGDSWTSSSGGWSGGWGRSSSGS
jgi:proteasome accessory factor A